MNEEPNVGRAAQARRLYHHVLNGGKLRNHDVEYLKNRIQELYDELAELKGVEPAELVCLGIDELMKPEQIAAQVRKIEILEDSINAMKDYEDEQT